MFVEIVVTSVSEAKAAAQGGADRLELLSGRKEGGMTPSLGLIDQVTKAVDIPVQVMLRTHAESFVYDEDDITVMLRDLGTIKATSAAGIVFGGLNEDGGIDEETLQKIIDRKGGLKLTFHRALDSAKNYEKAVRTLLDYDIDTLLTSGGAVDAIAGMDAIRDVRGVVESAGIECLAGAGLKPENIEQFCEKTGITHVHVGSGAKKDGVVDPETVKFIKRLK